MVAGRAAPLLLLAGFAGHATAFPPGHIYVSETTREGCLEQGNWVRQIDPTTGESWVIAGFDDGLCTNNGLAFTPDGERLLVLNYSRDNILAIDSEGTVSVRYNRSNGVAAPFGQNGLAFDRYGNLYISMSLFDPLWRIRHGVSQAEVVVARGTLVNGGAPVAMTPIGDVMTTTSVGGSTGALVLVTPTGQISQFGPEELTGPPSAIAIDRRGNVFFSASPGLGRYDAMDPATRRILPTTLTGYRAFALSDDERTLWACDHLGVYAIDPETGDRTQVFRFPSGIRGGRGIAVYIPPKPGDLNCDKRVNHFDIDPFVAALVDAEFYQQNYGWCRRDLADVNRDGVIDVFDVDAFVGAVVSQSDR